MSTKIEFHVIQSFPPANLNRDDTNMPKDCEFGGVRRARVSSQCIKRAIRLHPDFAKFTGVLPGDRTKLLSVFIFDKLIAAGKPEDEAEKVSREFTGELLGGMDKKSPSRSSVLFYVSEEEKETIVNGLLQEWELSLKGEFSTLVKQYQKQFSDRNSAPDIALFGRMLASDPKLCLEASCQVAHAISTHRINMEMDFFTAVDDLQTEEDAGAGMMGTTGFNAATFYRYAAIDWDQLTSNLGGDIKLAQKTIAGFTSSLVKAIPTGKQNAFAAQTPPALVLAVVREDGQAWSLANAFEKPIKKFHEQGILARSIEALERHWAQLNTVYGDPDQPAKPALILLDDTHELTYLKDAQVASLAALIEAVQQALPQEQ
ncbi:MAG: type I-E CRISPR-associated protein Cas7/Cse4/CasC [Chloroflexota bacterium]|nr:type I-E CRISPR-associated protein Cas7/Cse4/CasC [Chloroflexota bacterium]